MAVDKLRYKLTNYIAKRIVLGGVLPNDGYITGVPKSIHKTLVASPGTGNVGGGLDLLHSYTLPAGSLRSNGDYVDLLYGGRFANTEADKQVRLRFNGQLIISFGAVIDLENIGWNIGYRIYRRTVTETLHTGLDIHGNLRQADGAIVVSPSGAFIVARTDYLTVSNLDTTNIVIELHGEGSANDDVLLRTAEVMLTRF